MKRMAFFVFAWVLTISCSKNTENTGKLEGRWQLTAMFLAPSGNGRWYTVDSIPLPFLQFNPDGSLTMSAYVSSLYNDPIGYTVTSNTKIAFNYPNGGNTLYGENIVTYQLTDSVLTIIPPDMEYAEEKYIRVKTNP